MQRFRLHKLCLKYMRVACARLVRVAVLKAVPRGHVDPCKQNKSLQASLRAYIDFQPAAARRNLRTRSTSSIDASAFFGAFCWSATTCLPLIGSVWTIRLSTERPRCARAVPKGHDHHHQKQPHSPDHHHRSSCSQSLSNPHPPRTAQILSFLT